MPAHASRTLAPAPSAPPSRAERRLLAPARPRHRPADAGTPTELSASPAARPVKLRSVDSGFVSLVIITAYIVTNVFIAIVINGMEEVLDGVRQDRRRLSHAPASRGDILRDIRATQQALLRLEQHVQQLPD